MKKLFSLFFFFVAISLSAQINISPAQWQEDLAFLKETINQDYPFLFKKITKEEWNNKANKLYDKIPSLPEHKIAAGIAELVASFEYGHTVLSISDDLGFHMLPFNLYAFSDGVYVEGVIKEDNDILGAKVLRIDNTPIEEAIQKIRRVVPAENDQFHKAYGLNNLRVIELLHATEIIDKMGDSVTFTFEKNGSSFQKTLKGMKNLGVPRAYGYVRPDSVWTSVRDQSSTPNYLKHLDKNYYYEMLSEQNTLYVRQSRVFDQEGQTIKDFYAEVFKYIEDNNVERLVIDVRLNGGGNNYNNKSVITGLIKSEAINQIGNLMVIIGRRTFSACQNLVNEMSNYTNAVFVGEPTAENINFYGDNRPVELPNSKLTAYLSFAWWQDKAQWENGPWLAPHLAVEMSFEEYKNNEDPVLETALSFDGEAFHLNPMVYITGLFTSGQIGKLQSEVASMVQDPRYSFFDFEGEFNKAGENLLESKRGMESMFVFNMTSQLYPKSARTHFNLGKTQAFLGQKDQAKASLMKAMELDVEGGMKEEIESLLRSME